MSQLNCLSKITETTEILKLLGNNFRLIQVPQKRSGAENWSRY